MTRWMNSISACPVPTTALDDLVLPASGEPDDDPVCEPASWSRICIAGGGTNWVVTGAGFEDDARIVLTLFAGEERSTIVVYADDESFTIRIPVSTSETVTVYADGPNRYGGRGAVGLTVDP
jgi:hypothetical protein